MFNWISNRSSISFFLTDGSGEKIPVSRYHEFQKEYLSQISILTEWLDNGQATDHKTSIEVELEEVLNLDEIDQLLLGLPETYPYVVLVEADGVLAEPTFKFKYGFYDFVPNGNQLSLKRNGAVLESEDQNYILTPNQYKVLAALDRFNALPEREKSFQKNLKSFSEIKAFTSDEATVLDAFLQSQEVLSPEKIKIDVNFNNEVLEVTPHFDGIDNEALVKSFDRSTRIRPIYNVKNPDGRTTRVIVDDEQQKELDKVKKKRKVSDPDQIKELVENPEEFFDDDILDLSYFSQRVREIGLYKPKFYPFISPYKSQWIPGIIIKDKVEGNKKIYFKSEIDVAVFQEEMESAMKEGKPEFVFKEEKVSIGDAKRFLDLAKKQFSNPQKPVEEQQQAPAPDTSDKVLIIKENAELLEYMENHASVETLTHQFHQIDNLVEPISLKDHQEEGVAWLQSLCRKELNGCLLADDMGLGKTLQILYFVEWHAQNFDHEKPYLVVAPVSLLENWENEYRKFFNPCNLDVRRIYGQSGVGRKFSKQEVAGLQKKQILLTNYESLRSFQLNMCAVDYAVVVLDEAQKIKTPGTMITNVAKALKAEFKVAMTGTPVENSLVDLWCIMDFCVPGLLGNAKDFGRRYQKPLKNEDTDVGKLGESLRKEIGIFIKRRLKTDVAKDLPEKKSIPLKRIMPEVQVQRYAEEIELAQEEKSDGADRRNQILKSLWAIRDISDHPYLIDSQIYKFTSHELISSSAKLQVLMEVLEQVKKKAEKAIIFADRKDTQKLIQKVIYESYSIAPPIINGDTPSSKQRPGSSKLSRQQSIDRFQREHGFNVIIMSQLAAGVGLNVTGANHVIHYSRHWNPAKEEQATDRAYRIGQEKDVTVYYPMAVFPKSFHLENGETPLSFDEILDELLNRKKQLASSTLFPTEQSEVKPDEIFGTVFRTKGPKQPSRPVTIEDVDKLTPKLFEAFVAAIFHKCGYDVHLTPLSNDKGVDVVALNSKKNYLIQAKQVQSQVGNDAIREVFTSRNYYEALYGETFSLKVVTNSILGSSARTLADSTNVEFIERGDLIKMLRDHPISFSEIHQHEHHRLQKV